MLLLLFLLLHFFISPGCSFPQNPPESTTDSVNTSPAFNATIVDHDGVDITSQFQILLYQEPRQRPTPNNLSDRQVGQTRLMNSCRPSEIFSSSRCNFKDGRQGSLQSYTITCRHTLPPGERPSSHTTVSRRTRYCLADEICVTGTSQINLEQHERVTVTTAKCISQDVYRALSSPGKSSQDPGIAEAWAGLMGLSGRNVRAVVSQPDRQTPLEVDRLEIDATSPGKPVQKEQCRDCIDLGTGALEDGIAALKTEARLLTVGAAVGVLWLTVLAG